MTEIDAHHQSIETDMDHDTERTLPPLRHHWPLLGQELFTLEHVLTATSDPCKPELTEQEKKEQREKIRNTIVAQLYSDEGTYSRDTRYLAFLLLKQGRGGEIVGNPSALGDDGKKQELPYTGLEGYYVGSERTSGRPGLTREEILREEANIGVELLKTIKKRAVEHNSWDDVTRLMRALEWKNQDVEEVRTIQSLWGMVVRRLHVRVYHHPEFEPTLSEQMEHLGQLVGGPSGKTQEEKRSQAYLQVEYDRLVQERARMREEEREKERQERRARERVRTDRLSEFRHFQDETYKLLIESSQRQYSIGVQDGSLRGATITETITLPKIPDRNAYVPTSVHFTPEQLEGYLFLASLGEIGGDPLARSVLVSYSSSTKRV